jgi:t-SNARE complex subunit (syntaxin)
MNVDHYRQQELSHIERMIAELERLVQRDRLIGEQNPVIRPEYWRNRIHASVNASEATVSTTKHAAVLLERLTRLSEMSDRLNRPDQIK